MVDKKNIFALCISKIDEKAICELQIGWSFFNFFHVFENIVFEKNQAYNHETISSIARKIFWVSYGTLLKKPIRIRNVTFIFKSSKHFFSKT